MKPLVITARPLGDAEAYLPLESQPIQAQTVTLSGDGSALQPWEQQITLTNPGSEPWRGVIRITLAAELEDPRFFLPGFLYGTNRGDAPMFTDSQPPRLRMEEQFPAFRWWMTRSDRLSHPAAFVYGENRLEGLCASPWLVRTGEGRQQWLPGLTGDFDQYTGFGCGLEGSQVSYTLGWESAPWFFLDSHKYFPREPLGDNCILLEAGQSLTIVLYQFDLPAADDRPVH